MALLQRTHVGEFGIDRARSLEDLEERGAARCLPDALITAVELVPGIPVRRVDEIEAARIRHGQNSRINPFQGFDGARIVKAVGPDGG